MCTLFAVPLTPSLCRPPATRLFSVWYVFFPGGDGSDAGSCMQLDQIQLPRYIKLLSSEKFCGAGRSCAALFGSYNIYHLFSPHTRSTTIGLMIAAPTQRRSPALAPLSLYLISLQGALVAASASAFLVCGGICRCSAGRRRGLASGGAGGWRLRSSSRSADGRDAGEESADDGSNSFPGKLSRKLRLFLLAADHHALGLCPQVRRGVDT